MDDFYNEYFFGLKKFISKKIDNLDDVEEITHDVLMAGFNSRSTFNHKSSEFSWLCGIAKHKVIDFYRKKKLKTIIFGNLPVLEEVADKALGPEGEGLKNELKTEIKLMLKDIGKGYGKILRLKYVEGFRVEEIAKTLCISVKAAESRLIRAKIKFRKGWKYGNEAG